MATKHASGSEFRVLPPTTKNQKRNKKALKTNKKETTNYPVASAAT